MKVMRLAMCVAVFALIGGIATSGDMDISALQAKLAAQEARLNDLQSKVNYSRGGEIEGVISMRKNAVVTIGGQLNTRYFHYTGNVKSSLGNPYGEREKVYQLKASDLKVADAKLRVKIDVNDYFDAYLQADLQDSDSNRADAAQRYWIRWKNVCNSGFGLLVGRSDLVFGAGNPAGICTGYYGAFDYMNNLDAVVGIGEGMFIGSQGMVAMHTGWDYSRTTQVTPYWESQDGKFKAEVSFFQSLDRANGGRFETNRNGYILDKSINYGFGTLSSRLTWKPIEGLTVVGSVVNFYNNVDYDTVPGYAGNKYSGGYVTSVLGHDRTSSNNLATDIAVRYRPCFFPKLNVWGSWTHGWNEGWVKDMDSDTFNFGFSYDITDSVMFFAQGDIMRVKNDDGVTWHKANAWASYTGLKYTLPYGVELEAGWRHEQSTFKARNGWKHTKSKLDTVYAHLGFQF